VDDVAERGAHVVGVGLGEDRAYRGGDPQLGDLELHVAGLCRQHPEPVPVALGRAGLGPLMGSGADHRGGFGLDQLLEDPLQARADAIGHLTGMESGKQFGQVCSLPGSRRESHRDPDRVRAATEVELRVLAASWLGEETTSCRHHPAADQGKRGVGDTGLEPVTSAV